MNPSSGDRIPNHLEGEALERAIHLAETRLSKEFIELAQDFNAPRADAAWERLVERLSSITTSL